MYIYESHMGGFYSQQIEQDYESLYCEECGDSDTLIGDFETATEFLEYYSNGIAVNTYDGGYDLDYILDFLKDDFTDCPTKEEAIATITKSRTNEEKEYQ